MSQAIKWGLITALLMIIWLFGFFLILNSLRLNIPKATLRTVTGALGFVVLFIGILYGMKAVRLRTAGNEFNYLVAFKAGIIITLIVAIAVSLVSFFYVKWINPNMAEDMVKEATSSLKAAGTGVQETATKVESIRKEFSAQMQLLAALIAQTSAGCIFSLILAFFLRTNK